MLLEAGTLSHKRKYTSTVTSLSRAKLDWPVFVQELGGAELELKNELVDGFATLVMTIQQK